MLHRNIYVSIILFYGIAGILGVWGNSLHAESVVLSEKGKAQARIVVSEKEGDIVQNAAKDLAMGLEKITGAKFEIADKSEAGTSIMVGTAEEVPDILPPAKDKIISQEDYVLRSGKQTLHVVGRTPLAVEHAVWDLLHRVGFRQFFPSKEWEIWPEKPSLVLDLDVFESPDYYVRGLTYGGTGFRTIFKMDDSAPLKEGLVNWLKRNRVNYAFDLRSGHAYEAIIRRNQTYFEQHPEALHASKKLVAHEDAALKIAAEHALKDLRGRQAKGQPIDSVNMDPSDGGGWPEKSPLGSVSNQAVTITNHVAEAIQEEFPGTRVGMLAYNHHTAPPTIKIHDKVVVMVSTYARKGGYGMKELLQGWSKIGATIGVTQPVFTIWSYCHDLPGEGGATDIDSIVQNLPEWYDDGARYWKGSSGSAWAPHGMGNYLIARLTWDVKEAEQKDTLLQDFYDVSFGPASGEMREFYEKYLFKSGNPLFSDDLIGRMYRQIDKALGIVEEAAKQKGANGDYLSGVEKRLESYIPYKRYLELYRVYLQAKGAEEARKAYEDLAHFAYRVQMSGNVMASAHSMVYSLLYWDRRMKDKFGIEGMLWEPSEDNMPTVLSQNDLRGMLKEGIAHNAVTDFEPRSFSRNLVPYEGMRGITEEQKITGEWRGKLLTRADNTLYLYADKEGTIFEFEVSGGNLWPDRGPVRLQLFSESHAVLEEVMDEATVDADKTLYKVKLKTPYKGLHRLVFGDGSGGGTLIRWPLGQRVVVPSSPENNILLTTPSIGDYYFYVPKGTRVIGMYSQKSIGKMLNPKGEIVLNFKGTQNGEFFSVPVPEAEAGCWWKFEQIRGQKQLLTVPPFLARQPSEALVPAEVVAMETNGEMDEASRQGGESD